jgi:hypothetical protein
MPGRSQSSRAILLAAVAAFALALAAAGIAFCPREGARGPAEAPGTSERTSHAAPEVVAPRTAAPVGAGESVGSGEPEAAQAPSIEATAELATGAIRARLVDGDGEPLAEVPVFLAIAGETEPRRTTCDVGGVFRFDSVPDGACKVALGGAESPIVPALEASVTGGVTDLGDLVLPPLGELEVLVVDDSDRPVPSIGVTGRGSRGGTVDALTDTTGHATARFLPAGEIRLFAGDPSLGRGNTIVELAAGGRATARISLRRAP